MNTILGLKLSDDNIAWSVLDNDGSHFQLLRKGVEVFQKGVKVDEKGETSRAAEKTAHRSSKIMNYRRKCRKIQVLEVLSKYGYSPSIPMKELKDWKYKKVYPTYPAFNEWLKNDNSDSKEDRTKQIKNPYYFRYLAATQKLDIKNEIHRLMLGRAFYHLTQRRGYSSNRLDGKEKDGTVMRNIKALNEAKGDETLGQYFYELYKKGERIRGNYTDRIQHYLHEFETICKFQNLPQDFADELRTQIFFQRPLKVKKQHIGKCPYESKKYRCAVSHPVHEEFRMLSFMNNIKMKTPDDDKLRLLTEEEKQAILPLFFRKSKVHFPFEDICKKLAPKNLYKCASDEELKEEHWAFNYDMKVVVAGCPVSAQFEDLFGQEYKDVKFKYIREKDNKESFYDIFDIWHVLSTFEDPEKLAEFATLKLGLDEDETSRFLKIKLPSGHAALSQNAMAKINVYLQQGLTYSHAVFMANMKTVVPEHIWSDPENQKIINDEVLNIIEKHHEESQYIKAINQLIQYNKKNDYTWSEQAEEQYKAHLHEILKDHFGHQKFDQLPEDDRIRLLEDAFNKFKVSMKSNNGTGEFATPSKLSTKIKIFLLNNFGSNLKLNRLYHPSSSAFHDDIEKSNNDTTHCVSASKIPVKNPVFLRMAFKLQNLLNKLLDEKIIDNRTIIKVNCDHSIRNSNERQAIKDMDRYSEKRREEIRKEIVAIHKKQGIEMEITREDYIRYELWEEQKEQCIYTGEQIELEDFVGEEKKYDLNFIIPLSKSFDISKANMTLTSVNFMDELKQNKMPCELDMYETLKERLTEMNKEIFIYKKQIEGFSMKSKTAGSPEEKSRAIVGKHKANIRYSYLLTKYRRLLAKEMNPNHKFAITYDNNLNSIFIQKYLKYTFQKVYLVSNQSVDLFAKEWAVRSNFKAIYGASYYANCIDSIIAACIYQRSYDKITSHFETLEEGCKSALSRPWGTFIETLQKGEKDVIINHDMPVDLLKKTKRTVRQNGKIVRDKDGKVVHQKCDTVRGALHKDKRYGFIEVTEENKKGELVKVLKAVIRKPIEGLEAKDIKNIVDPNIKIIVQEGKKNEPVIQKGIDNFVKENKEMMREIRKIERENKKKEEGEELQSTEFLESQIQIHEKTIEKLKKDIDNLYSISSSEGQKMLIRRVRIFAPMVKNPLVLKKHSTPGKQEHKKHQYVVNDGNYKIAIYNGIDKKKKPQSGYVLMRNLDATKRMKELRNEHGDIENLKQFLFTPTIMKKETELSFTCSLATNTTVLFYENEPDEVWNLSRKELNDRLYRVVGLSEQNLENKFFYGILMFKKLDECRPVKGLPVLSGPWATLEQKQPSMRRMNHGQFKGLVLNEDFVLDFDGNIHPAEFES